MGLLSNKGKVMIQLKNPDPNKIDNGEWESLMFEIQRFAGMYNMTECTGIHTLPVLGDVGIGMESDYKGIPEKALYTDEMYHLSDIEKSFQSACVRGNLEIENPCRIIAADKGLFNTDNLIVIRSKSGGLLVQITHSSITNIHMNTFIIFSPNGKPKMRGLIIV